jgi:YaiO family outer membrane protein
VIRFLAVVALCCGVPVAAQGGDAYEQAVAARLAGDNARAEALLDAVLAREPGNVDARVQRGYARLARGRLDEAQADFTAVLAAAPDYADARRGLELVAERRAVPGTDRRGFVLAEGAISDLSGGARDWREFALGALVPVDDRVSVDLRAASYRRFGLDDFEIDAGATLRAQENLWLRFGGSVTPSADYRPEWGLRGGIDYRLAGEGDATVLGLDLRYQSFPTQDVVTIAPQVVRYFDGERFSLTARGIGTIVDGGTLRLGGLARVDFRPREGAGVYLGVATGPDSEQGVVTDTTSLFVGGEVPLGGRVSLLVGAAREWREGGGERTEGRIGLKLGF